VPILVGGVRQVGAEAHWGGGTRGGNKANQMRASSWVTNSPSRRQIKIDMSLLGGNVHFTSLMFAGPILPPAPGRPTKARTKATKQPAKPSGITSPPPSAGEIPVCCMKLHHEGASFVFIYLSLGAPPSLFLSHSLSLSQLPLPPFISPTCFSRHQVGSCLTCTLPDALPPSSAQPGMPSRSTPRLCTAGTALRRRCFPPSSRRRSWHTWLVVTVEWEVTYA